MHGVPYVTCKLYCWARVSSSCVTRAMASSAKVHVGKVHVMHHGVPHQPSHSRLPRAAGVAFSKNVSSSTDNIGYVIPRRIVEHFLHEYVSHGSFRWAGQADTYVEVLLGAAAERDAQGASASSSKAPAYLLPHTWQLLNALLLTGFSAMRPTVLHPGSNTSLTTRPRKPLTLHPALLPTRRGIASAGVATQTLENTFQRAYLQVPEQRSGCAIVKIDQLSEAKHHLQVGQGPCHRHRHSWHLASPAGWP